MLDSAPSESNLVSLTDESAPIALSLDGISVSFNGKANVLSEIDLTVSKGEFISLVGPSGCGKTTLLRAVAGLTQHTSGEVQVDRADLGYVFQDPHLMPWRNLQSNTELLMELREFDGAEMRKLAQSQLELVGLGGKQDLFPHQLSGGMKMRAALARALCLSPGLFLFDEPFAALDEITRQKLGDDLQTLYLANRFAAIFITHSIAEAVYLSSRVLLMSTAPGQIIDDIDVPFAYPRKPELRYTPEFAKVCQQVSKRLASEVSS